jgi:hypothetical protein
MWAATDIWYTNTDTFHQVISYYSYFACGSAEHHIHWYSRSRSLSVLYYSLIHVWTLWLMNPLKSYLVIWYIKPNNEQSYAEYKLRLELGITNSSMRNIDCDLNLEKVTNIPEWVKCQHRYFSQGSAEHCIGWDSYKISFWIFYYSSMRL